MRPAGVRRIAVAGTVAIALAAPVRAQEAIGRVAVEAVVSASVTSETLDDPFLIVDAVSTVRLGNGWDAVIRPWARRMPGGDWGAAMYQLQLRYTSSTRVPVRIDAGIISSPLGLATLELRPDRNPTIAPPFYYFVPLPAFDGHFDRATLLSGGYPLGAVVSLSGARWDARGGVTDGTPARKRRVFGGSSDITAPQVVAGGGFTPIVGLRFGVGFGHGRYRSDVVTVTGERIAAASATVFNVEGEYAIGYTRIAGEWVADRFETTMSPAVAHGFTLVAVRTLTPRWFAAGRAARASSPVMAAPTPGRRSASSVEATLGYRLTPQVTLRAGYQGSTAFNRASWEHAAAASLVWAHRWW